MGSNGKASAATHEFEGPSLECKSVTVYADRAEVKRVVAIKALSGSNEVIISKLPPTIDEDSIRVDGKGNASISEVQYQKKHLSTEEDVKNQRKQLTEQLQDLKDQRQLELSIAHVSLDSLDDFLGRYSARVGALDKQILSLDAEERKLSKKISVAQENLNKLAGGADDTYLSREVSILLEAKEDAEVVLDVSYLVSQASWTPSYDLRVFAEEKNLKLQYYGLIKQNSGEDWDETKLYLSTASPSVGGEVPFLRTLNVTWASDIVARQNGPGRRGQMISSLSFAQGQRWAQNLANTSDELLSCGLVGDDMEYDRLSDGSLSLAKEETTVKDSVISTTFEIPRTGTIPSDNTSHKVNVALVDLKCSFEYISVPKKAPIAYLKARIVNTSPYPLLKGPISVFLDNSFVAKSEMRAASPGEQFTCSLGPDMAVRINYKPLHKYHQEAGLLSKTSIVAYEQKIELKNTRKEKVTLKLLENVPLSSYEKVKVSLIEPVMTKQTKNIRLNKENNLEWTLDLGEGEHKTITVKYSIEHPRNKKIELREN